MVEIGLVSCLILHVGPPVRLYILTHEAQAIQQRFHQSLSILLHGISLTDPTLAAAAAAFAPRRPRGGRSP